MSKKAKDMTRDELLAETKRLRSQLGKAQHKYRQLKEAGDRLLLYVVGPHHAACLGLTNVKPLVLDLRPHLKKRRRS